MAEADSPYARYRIFLFLAVVAAVVLGLAEAVHYFAGTPGLTVIDIGISAALTAALVILYFKQTSILESQRDLLTQEMNREARQQHTETLRDRVQLWHGEPEQTVPKDTMGVTGKNLPSVKGASIESAPTGSGVVFGEGEDEEEEFRVIPYFLKDDRYLNDLLENHAPDLRETTDEINRLHDRFVELRDEFSETFDGTNSLETDDFTLTPHDFVYQWLFELLVMNERDRIESFDDLRDKALSEFDRGDTKPAPDGERILVRAETTPRNTHTIYEAHPDTIDLPEMGEMEDKAREDTKQLLKQVLDHIEEEQPYPRIVEAGQALDDAQESIHRLEQLLIEYDGRPIYPGDCKYLQEARINEVT